MAYFTEKQRLAAIAECERAMRDAGATCLKCWIEGCREARITLEIHSAAGIASTSYACAHACHAA